MRLSALRAMAEKLNLPHLYRYGMNRPGSLADKTKNPPGTRRRKVFVEPIRDEDWKVFKGDTVSGCARGLLLWDTPSACIGLPFLGKKPPPNPKAGVGGALLDM